MLTLRLVDLKSVSERAPAPGATVRERISRRAGGLIRDQSEPGYDRLKRVPA
jgi:hypothetical protein